MTCNLCTYEQNIYLGDGESACSSSSVMVWASPVSHQEVQKPQQSHCCSICFRSFFGKLMFLHRPACEFSLYHLHDFADSAETTS